MPIPLFTEGEYKKSLKHVQPSFENDDKPQRCPKSNVIPQNHTHSRFPPTKESHPITIPTHNQIALHEKKFYFPHFNVKCHAFNWHKEAETASFLAENIKNHCFEEPHHDHKHYHKHEYHHQAGGEKDNEVGCKDIFCQGPEEDLEFVLDDAEELSFVVKGNDGVIIHETALQTTKVRLQNICCHKEARIVQEELGKLPGINTIRVNVLGRVAYISHDPDKVRPIDLVESLNKRHLGTSIVEAGEEKEIKQGFPKELKILLVILAVQAVLLSIALGAMFSHKAWYMWVAIAQICFGMLPVLKKCYHAVSRMQIDLNVLITVAVIGILGIRQWIEGAAVVFIFILANLLQQYCFYRVHNTISSLMLAQPSKAVMACTGELVDVEDVSIGSIIAIRQGELIPLDGVVVKGSASVDESLISGEAAPVEKTLKSQAYSGTVIQHGYLELETTSSTSSSTISKIAALIEEAQLNVSPTEQMMNQFASYYTPLVVLLAAIVFLVPFILHLSGAYAGSIETWGKRALIVLVTACPCALLMATPVLVICGISGGARLGTLIKGGTFLEALSQIKFLAFDKTGTLTEGKFKVGVNKIIMFETLI